MRSELPKREKLRSDKDAPRCVSPSIATEAPRRADDLRDGNDARINMSIEYKKEPNFMPPDRDSEEPSHVRPRTDSELPSVRKLDTETDDTRHARDRNDNGEPKHVASKTLRVAPRRDAPKTDRDDPNFAKLRTEREVPNRAQMKTDKDVFAHAILLKVMGRLNVARLSTDRDNSQRARL